ncbi:hypothetical protein NUSPORA_00249 [Nucleospora cyclopteri]
MANKFSWTEEYRKTWDEEKDVLEGKNEKYVKEFNPNRKNIIRHLLVVVDTSESIEKNDYLPTIRYKIITAIPHFIKEFKKANPLSSLSFMTVSNLFEHFSKDFDAKMLGKIGKSKFSLLNCLKSVEKFMKNCKYPKETVIVTGSIGSHDEEPLNKILETLQKHKIKINIVSLCGEVTLFKNVCKSTNGELIVPVSAFDLEAILNSFISPSESFEQKCTLLEIGFPKKMQTPHLCLCHLNFNNDVFECPQCEAPICSIPRQCPICELMLISPLSICKSNVMCYPLENFVKVEQDICKVCNKEGILQCSKCKSIFCNDCNQKIHNLLMFCPYC